MARRADLSKRTYPEHMRRITKVTLGLAALALALSGCSKSESGTSLSGLTHLHSVATDGTNIYVASHHGLYVWNKKEWKLQGDNFDIMGLAIAGKVFYASGHPGADQNLPDPAGVLISKDQGLTWKPVTLTGQVDFHLLEVSGENFIGVAANYGSILKSPDGAKNWEPVQAPGFSDVTINPDSPDEVLLSSENNISISKDFAHTFTTIGSLQNVSKVEWNRKYIYATTDSAVFRAKSPEDKFQGTKYKFQEIIDIESANNIVVVLDKLGVHVSYDYGTSFALVGKNS
jgi:hypothetical protein